VRHDARWLYIRRHVRQHDVRCRVCGRPAGRRSTGQPLTRCGHDLRTAPRWGPTDGGLAPRHAQDLSGLDPTRTMSHRILTEERSGLSGRAQTRSMPMSGREMKDREVRSHTQQVHRNRPQGRVTSQVDWTKVHLCSHYKMVLGSKVDWRASKSAPTHQALMRPFSGRNQCGRAR
jgi:hypothetical protein